jgi:hypothetical protein
MDTLQELQKPFPADEIQWRLSHTTEKDGRLIGLALAYYDARALYDRLDHVCGPVNWQIRYPHANGKTCAELGIRIDGEWIWKANGAGDTNVEAEKGAFSDAAKRAGVAWGIGRYLYEFKSTWVECEKRGKHPVIKQDQYKKLDNAYKQFLKQGNFTFENAADTQSQNYIKPLEQWEYDELGQSLQSAQSLDDLKQQWAKVYNARHRMTDEQFDFLVKVKDDTKAQLQQPEAAE